MTGWPAPVVPLSLISCLSIVGCEAVGPAKTTILLIALGAIALVASGRIMSCPYSKWIIGVMLTLPLLTVLSWSIAAQEVDSQTAALSKYIEDERATVSVVGTAVSEPKPKWSEDGSLQWSFVLKVKDGPLGGKSLRATVPVTQDGQPVRWGEIWRVTGTIDSADSIEEPVFKRYLFHKRASGTLKSTPEEPETHLVMTDPALAYSVSAWTRGNAIAVSQKYLPRDETALLLGITLGDGSLLTQEMVEAFRVTGLAHIVVASGMNVAIVLVAVLAPLIRLGVSRLAQAAVGAPIVVTYVLAAGAQPSILRAGVMAVLTLVLRAAFTRAGLINTIAASAIIILLIDPFAFYEISFQLSYGATIGLALLMPLSETIMSPLLSHRVVARVPNVIKEAATVTLAAQIAVTPMVLHYFGTLAPYSMLANIMAVPPSTIVLVLGLIAPLLAYVPLLPAVFMFAPLYSMVAYMLWVADTVQGIPGADLAIEPVTLGAAMALYVVVAVACLLERRKDRFPSIRILLWLREIPAQTMFIVFLAMIAVTVVLAVATVPDHDELVVEYLDVGQGDAALIIAPSGETVLIDTGPPEGDVGKKLADLGVREVSLLVISHFQRDHAGSLPDVAKTAPVRAALLPYVEGDTAYTEGLRRSSFDGLKDRGTKIVEARIGQRVEMGDLLIEVVDAAEPGEDLNEASVAVMATYKNVNFLFTGDLGIDSLEKMIVRNDMDEATVIKVPHHGSKYSASALFYRELEPALAVISVGCNNGYGHPHRDTLQMLDDISVESVRTDQLGTIRLESDGNTVVVTSKGSTDTCR